MKKTKSPKLTLSRETLIGLDTDRLHAPRGGVSLGPSTCYTLCITCGQVCVQTTIVSVGC
ncbi:MAG TPA: hypothetical protein VIJ61_15535 [Thermoanaerobaculia bacterium]|jgi:hypothetical protein